MSKAATQMAKAKPEESKQPDRTVKELRDLVRETHRQEHKTFRHHEYDLRRVVEVYGNLRESEITQQHLDEYPKKRRAKAKGNLSDTTIRGEKDEWLFLLRFESNREGYSSGKAAQEAKTS